MSKFTLVAKAKLVRGNGKSRVRSAVEVGAWTDGIGVFSEQIRGEYSAYSLQVGATYKVTIERIKDRP